MGWYTGSAVVVVAAAAVWSGTRPPPRYNVPSLAQNGSSWRVARVREGREADTGDFDLLRLPRCTVSHASVEEFAAAFTERYHLKQPVLVRGWRPSWVQELQARTRREALLRRHGDEVVYTGVPTELVRDGQKKARTAEVLREYIAGLPGERYLFDDGRFLRGVGLDGDWETLPGLSSLGTFNDWRTNRSSLVAGGQELRGPLITFALGGAGQGVAFHLHADSYNLQLHGRKRWALYGPGKMTPTGFSRAESFVEWLQRRRGEPAFAKPLECVQEPGETLYIPEGFYHATACLEDCVGVVHQAERFVPGSPFDHFVRSRQVESAEEVLYHLKRAIELDSTNSDYWTELGVLFGGSGQWDHALQCFRTAASLNPLNADARRNLVTALVKVGGRIEALGWLISSWLR